MLEIEVLTFLWSDDYKYIQIVTINGNRSLFSIRFMKRTILKDWKVSVEFFWFPHFYIN